MRKISIKCIFSGHLPTKNLSGPQNTMCLRCGKKYNSNYKPGNRKTIIKVRKK